ncbi:MAG: GSCFA domain-containing protein [Bacteroidota bacterium]
MDNFRTELILAKAAPIHHAMPVVTAGSCFADHIGSRLKDTKFPCLANPFGVAYSPVAIHNNLLAALRGTAPAAQGYLQQEEGWKHFQFHSRWWAATQQELQTALTKTLTETASFLASADVVLLTYGTAWVYKHRATEQLVANCHKMPAKEFDKLLLSPAQIIESFGVWHQALRSVRPHVRIILTVSPVRHIKDTLELNQVSKAALRLACHYITQQFSNTEYFPAYELLMDDLRDYRFYDRDLIHPSGTAIDYIWQKFSERYFDRYTQQRIEKINAIRQALAHRPFQPHAAAHQKFLRELLKQLEELKAEVNMEEEITSVQSQII